MVAVREVCSSEPPLVGASPPGAIVGAGSSPGLRVVAVMKQ